MSRTSKRRDAIVGLAALMLGAGAAQAATLEITITNNQEEGGVFLTPLYLGFHDGSFDTFDAGTVASRGLEQLAEDGVFGPGTDQETIAGERLAVAPTSQGCAITGPDGFGSVMPQPPLIDTGETASIIVDVDTDNRFLQYLSMILPSNDNFIGNDDALEIFDSMGNFLGDQVIEITQANVWDAGTEVNNGLGLPFGAAANTKPAAVPNQEEGGLISLAGDLSFLENFQFTNGAGFLVDNIGDSIATITIREVGVSPVPLTAGAPLILSALGLFGLLRMRNHKAVA